MLKKYEKLDKIGQGSFGKVYKVRSRKTRQLLVLKEIDLSCMGPKTRRDAENEVKILKTIKHRHIVGFVEAFKQSGKLNIILEYCEKGDLGQYIRRQSRLIEEDTIMKIFVQICLGLNHLHNENILHRDIKAMNIFLKKNFEVRIGDLGVAKILKEEFDFANTVIGTPYYLSPELCAEKPYNEKNDVWALGCLLYEMCKQTQPFKGSHAHKLKEAIKERDYADISPKYSSRLKLLIRLMLCKDADKRPSMKEILEEPFVRDKIEAVEAEWEKKKIGRFEVVKKFNNEFGYAKKLRQQRMDNMKSVNKKRNFKKKKGRGSKIEYDENGRKNMLDELMKGKKISHLLRDADEKVKKAEREKKENDLTKGGNNKNPYFRRLSDKHNPKPNRNSRQNNQLPDMDNEADRSKISNNYPPKRVVKSRRVIAQAYKPGDPPRAQSRRGVKSGANSPGPKRAVHAFLKRKSRPQPKNQKKKSRHGSQGRLAADRSRRKASGHRKIGHNGYDINRDMYLQEVMKNFGGKKKVNDRKRGLKIEKAVKKEMMKEMEEMYFQNMGMGQKDRLDAFFDDKKKQGGVSRNYNNYVKDKKRDQRLFGNLDQKSGSSDDDDDEFAFSYSNNYKAIMRSKRELKRSSRRIVSKPESKRDIEHVRKSRREVKKKSSRNLIKRKSGFNEKKVKKIERQKTYPVKMNKSGLLRNKHNKGKIQKNIMNKSCNIRDHYSPDKFIEPETEFRKAKLPFELPLKENENLLGGPECNPENYIMNATGELVLRPDNLKKKARNLTRSVILQNLNMARQSSESDLKQEKIERFIENHDEKSKLTPIVQREERESENIYSESEPEGQNNRKGGHQNQMRESLQLLKKKELSRLNDGNRNNLRNDADSEETKLPRQLNPKEIGPRNEKKDFGKWYSEDYFKECLEEDGEIVVRDASRRRNDISHRDSHKMPEINNNIRQSSIKLRQPDSSYNHHIALKQNDKKSPSIRSRTPESESKAESPRSRYISSNQKLHPSFSCGYTVSNKRNYFGRKIQRVIKKKREASPNQRMKRRRLFNLDKRRKGSEVFEEVEEGFMGRLREALREQERVGGLAWRAKSVGVVDRRSNARRVDLGVMGRMQKLRNVYVEMAMTGIKKFGVDQKSQQIRSESQNFGEIGFKAEEMEVYIRYHDGVLRVMRDYLELKWAEQMEELNSRTNPKIEGRRNPIIVKPAIKKKRNNYVIGKGQSQEEHKTCLVGESNAIEENLQYNGMGESSMNQTEYTERPNDVQTGIEEEQTRSEGLVAELKKEIMRKDEEDKTPVIKRKNSRYIDREKGGEAKAGDIMLRKSHEFQPKRTDNSKSKNDEVFIRKKKARAREELSEIRDVKSDKRSVMMATAEEMEYWRKIDEEAEKIAKRDAQSLMRLREMPIANDYTQVKETQSRVSEQEGTIVERVEGGFLVDNGKKDWLSGQERHNENQSQAKPQNEVAAPANKLELLHKKLKQKVKKKIKLSVQRIQKEVGKIDSPNKSKQVKVVGNKIKKKRPPIRALEYHRDEMTSQKPIQPDEITNKGETARDDACMYDMMIPNLIMTEEQEIQKKPKESPIKMKNRKFTPYLKLMGVKTKKEIREEDFDEISSTSISRQNDPGERKTPKGSTRNKNIYESQYANHEHRENVAVVQVKRKPQQPRAFAANREEPISLVDMAPHESQIERLGRMVVNHEESRYQREKQFQERAREIKIQGMKRAEQNMKRDKMREEEIYRGYKPGKKGNHNQFRRDNRRDFDNHGAYYRNNRNEIGQRRSRVNERGGHVNLRGNPIEEGRRLELRRNDTRKKSANRRPTRVIKGYQPFVRNIKNFDLEDDSMSKKKFENQRKLRKMQNKQKNHDQLKNIQRSIEGVIDKIKTKGNEIDRKEAAGDYHEIGVFENNQNQRFTDKHSELVQVKIEPDADLQNEREAQNEMEFERVLEQNNRWKQGILRNPFDDDEDDEEIESEIQRSPRPNNKNNNYNRNNNNYNNMAVAENGNANRYHPQTPITETKPSSKGTLKSIGQFSDFLKRFNLVEEKSRGGRDQHQQEEVVAPAPTPTAEKNPYYHENEISRNGNLNYSESNHNRYQNERANRNLFQNPLNLRREIVEGSFEEEISTERQNQSPVFRRKPYLSRPDLSYLTSGAGNRKPKSRQTFTSEQSPPGGHTRDNQRISDYRADRGVAGTSIEMRVHQENVVYQNRDNVNGGQYGMNYKRLNKTTTILRENHYSPTDSGAHAILGKFKNQTGLIRNYYDHGEEDEEEEEEDLDDTRFLRSGLPKSVSQMEKKRPAKKHSSKKSQLKRLNQKKSEYASLNLGGQNFQISTKNESQNRNVGNQSMNERAKARGPVYQQIPNPSYSQNMESEELEWKKHALIEQLSGAIGRAAISRVLNETLRWFRRKEQLDSYDLRRIEAAVGKRGSLDKRFLPTLYQLIDVEIAIQSSNLNRAK